MTVLLPRILATVLLLGSLAMIAPLGVAVASLLRGQPVASSAYVIPLLFLGTGAALSWILARKAVADQLFIPAFALWVLAVGYYFFMRFAG